MLETILVYGTPYVTSFRDNLPRRITLSPIWEHVWTKLHFPEGEDAENFSERIIEIGNFKG
jgi:hypothetical protein